jgi:hypothetical protein
MKTKIIDDLDSKREGLKGYLDIKEKWLRKVKERKGKAINILIGKLIQNHWNGLKPNGKNLRHGAVVSSTVSDKINILLSKLNLT